MKSLHGLALAIALALAPAAVMAQQDQPGDREYANAPEASYDDGERVDEYGRRIDGDERYDEDRYAGSYSDERYGGGGDYRYDDRYDERYARHDDRYDRRYDRDRPYGGDCRRRPDRASPVLGFILGGLIGNQFGHGAGRAAATAVGAHLGHEIARDAVNNCEDRYGHGYRGRGYGPSMGFSFYGGGHRSGYSVSFGSPFGYG
jgi:hypothetical protein